MARGVIKEFFWKYHICMVIVVDVDLEMKNTPITEQLLLAKRGSLARVILYPLPLV